MQVSLSFESLVEAVAEPECFNMIPVFTEILGDLDTPVSVFSKLDQGRSGFLLESVEGGLHQARYSFIGTSPDDVLVQSGKDPLLALERRLAHVKLRPTADLPTFSGGAMGFLTYDCVRYFEPTVEIPSKDALQLPESVFMFFNSLVVFDNLRHTIKVVAHVDLTDLRPAAPRPARYADSAGPADSAGAADSPGVAASAGPAVPAYATSVSDKAEATTFSPPPAPVDVQVLRQRYDAALAAIAGVVARLAHPINAHASLANPVIYLPPSSKPTYASSASSSTSTSSSSSSSSSSAVPAAPARPALESNQGPHGYEAFVTSLKQNILAGDIIQAVPSQRLSRALAPNTSAFDIYRQFRVVNPSPYMFYVRVVAGAGAAHSATDSASGEFSGAEGVVRETFEIVGASPEQLVKVDAARRITTHPIAGTRRRGATPEEDLALERELLSSEKERAEHVMLVDLGRNDVGRVAVTGSVHVDSLMHVERYSHVMHIVSHVSGTLRPDRTVYDALRAVFPAGTVSGAPKVRAMQLVAALEKERRGIYAGCVGYVSHSGVLDTAIAIRTLLVKGGKVYLQAGGGIVYDSDPVAEAEETVNKMRGAEVAVLRAEAAAAARATQAVKAGVTAGVTGGVTAGVAQHK